jgi:hypothetical protein
MEIKRIGLNGFNLKIIAILAMVVDHVGAGIFPGLYWMRYIGRLTMPIMCYFIGEGFYRTHDVKGYAGRLLIFAVIAEAPFQLFFREPGNVMFTLLGGLLFLWAWRDLKNRLLAYAAMVLILFAVNIPGYETDYGPLGVLMVFLAGLGIPAYSKIGVANVSIERDEKILIPRVPVYPKVRAMAPALLCGANNLVMGLRAPLCYWPLFAGFLLCLYNGKRGRPMKYFFYVFYPLHLLILWGIQRVINN